MVIITYSTNEFIGSAALIYIALMFICIFFITRFKDDNLGDQIIKGFSYFMLIILTYISILYILETGELGDKSAFTILTLYSLFLFTLVIYTIVKFKDNFIPFLEKAGLK